MGINDEKLQLLCGKLQSWQRAMGLPQQCAQEQMYQLQAEIERLQEELRYFQVRAEWLSAFIKHWDEELGRQEAGPAQASTWTVVLQYDDGSLYTHFTRAHDEQAASVKAVSEVEAELEQILYPTLVFPGHITPVVLEVL